MTAPTVQTETHRERRRRITEAQRIECPECRRAALAKLDPEQ